MGVDSSTTATKVELRDADDGRLIGAGSATHRVTSRPPVSEADPWSWWQALHAATADLSNLLPDVAAVSVAAQQHGLVVVDREGKVIRPAKLWNDLEPVAQAERLVQAMPASEWARACGSVPLASFTIAKLAWLKERERPSFDRVALVLLPHDWLTLRLCGRAVTDRGDASGTGYWSPVENRWRPDLLALVDSSVAWDERLPAVLEPAEPAGTVTADAVRDLGLGAGALVGPGTGDNMAASLGIGLADPDVAVSIGTSGTVYSVSDSPVADASGAVAGFADATGRYLPLVCTLNATRVTDTFARILGVDLPSFDHLALSTEAGASGVVLVPYLDGERTPNRPDARGKLSGLRADVSRAQVARAAFEGVVCGLLDGLDALEAARCMSGDSFGGEGRIVAVGGGSRSAAYTRVLSDLSGRQVVVPRESELVAAGACMQAAAVLHDADPAAVSSAWGIARGEVVEPGSGVGAGEIRARYARERG